MLGKIPLITAVKIPLPFLLSEDQQVRLVPCISICVAPGVDQELFLETEIKFI